MSPGKDFIAGQEVPLAMAQVLMLLANNAGFPEGSTTRGYEITVPLGPDGRLDEAAWRADPAGFTVRRFWEGEAERQGTLVLGRGGWRIDYGPIEEDDEPTHSFEAHVLRPGEYVTVREADGIVFTFRVVAVR